MRANEVAILDLDCHLADAVRRGASMQLGFDVDGVAVATPGTQMSYRAFTNADANIFYPLAMFRF